MEWKTLESEKDFNNIIEQSKQKTQVIFKHSTRCSISSMAKGRLERSIVPEGIDFHYLDLIANRNISNMVAEKLNVYHESPQILVIKNGECVFDESHNAISMDEIAQYA